MPMPRLMNIPSLNSCATRWRICSRLKAIAASLAGALFVLHETEVEDLVHAGGILRAVAVALLARHPGHQVQQEDRPADEPGEQHRVADRLHDLFLTAAGDA